MELYQVKLFYHPSCDHVDPDPDSVEEFFTLSTSSTEATIKVVSRLRIQRPHYPSSYQNDAVWKGMPQGITPEQALLVLQAAGLRVIK